MARIRSVHPGLFTDEAFVELSAEAQVFFIGLWTEADDQGVFEWKPTTLKMRLRPASTTPVEPLLAELAAANFVREFRDGGKRFGAIRNFRKYQRPKKPRFVYPLPSALREYALGAETEGDEAPSGSELDGDEAAPRSEPKRAKSPPSGERVPNSPPVKHPPVPQKGEIAPQMEGREGEEERREAAVADTSDDAARAEPAATPAAADADRIFRETGTKVLDLIGDPGTLNYARVRKWLESGADPDLDILPAVRQVIARERMRDLNWRPRGLTYFDGAIREWMDMRLRPLTGQRNGAATAPAPADPPPGTYLGRPTPLPEGHPARREHAHLSAYLDPKTRGLWAQTWDGVWMNRGEPRDEAEARARIAELEPIIWPAGGPKAPAATEEA